MGDNWIWMTNAFFLACAAFQPLLGQISDLFGRRWTTLCVVAIFMVGSAICGGARSEATLIAGRAVQGVGSGGILMAFGEYNVVPGHCQWFVQVPGVVISEPTQDQEPAPSLWPNRLISSLDVVVADLVPLRYRGNYVAIILLIYSIGTTMGALVGGLIVDRK